MDCTFVCETAAEHFHPTEEESEAAAALITSMRGSLTELSDKLDDVYQDWFISHGAMRDEIERLKAEMLVNAMECAELIANLTAERDAEKARTDAAVNIAVRNVFYDMIGNCKSLMCYTSPCSYCQHEKSREKCAACFENGNFELRDDLRGEKGMKTI